MIHYFALQSQQQRAWGTKACCFCLPCIPGLPGLHYTNSLPTWLPEEASDSANLSLLLQLLQIIFKLYRMIENFLGAGLGLIPQPLFYPCARPSKSAPDPLVSNGQNSLFHCPTVWGHLSSIPPAKFYLTLKRSLGSSSLSLQSLTPEYVRVPQHQIWDLGSRLPDKGGIPSNIHSQSSAHCLAQGEWLKFILNECLYGRIFKN